MICGARGMVVWNWLKGIWKGVPLKAPEPVKPLVLPGYDNDLAELQAHLESNDGSVERLARMVEIFQEPPKLL
jgi:hypothetical protein